MNEYHLTVSKNILVVMHGTSLILGVRSVKFTPQTNLKTDCDKTAKDPPPCVNAIPASIPIFK